MTHLIPTILIEWNQLAGHLWPRRHQGLGVEEMRRLLCLELTQRELRG